MRARKGVTPVVATALLLSIAVGSVVTAGIFMDDTLQDLREAFGDEVEDETGNPEVNIISAVRNPDNHTALVLRNSGGGPLDMTRGDGLTIIAGTSGVLQRGPDWNYSEGNPGVFSPGETTRIEIKNPEFPDAGEDPLEIELSGPQEISSGVICYPGENRC